MKLKQFQQYLQENNFDLAFFVHPDPNIIYFTQCKPTFSMLTVTPKSAVLHITKLDSAETKIPVKTISKDWEIKFQDKKIKKVGINKETLTLSFLDKLKKIYPQAKFFDVSEKIKELRITKTEEEIILISRSCQITSQAFNDLLPKLPKLTTELAVASFLDSRMRELGAEENAFPTIVANNKNAATPHHITSNTKIKKGFLLLDFGGCYKNYCSDMTRVIYLGTITKEEKKMYELLLHAQKTAISQVKEKVKFKELDDNVRKNLHPYSSHFIHSLGHGLGIEVHEAPRFDETSAVKKNQIFTIEPGIYFPGKYGLRIEDTLSFAGKTKILTTAPKDLIKA